MSNLILPQSSKHSFIVAGIDGTGSKQWMKADGSNSHTYRFIQKFGGNTTDDISKKWFHGPSDTTWGYECEDILQKALDFITARLRQIFPAVSIANMQPLQMFDVNFCRQSAYYNNLNSAGYYYGETSAIKMPVKVDANMLRHQILTTEDVKVVLVGHSRGGLIATVLAKMLSPVVKVYFMGLYDSVDRQPCLDGAKLVNVQYVYHARRDPSVGSRFYFGNTSMDHGEVQGYHEKTFYTSHGGMGGDFVSDPSLASFGTDTSCIPQPEEKVIYSEGVPVIVSNIHPLTKKFGKPINQICADGSREADLFVKGGALEKGLPVRD